MSDEIDVLAQMRARNSNPIVNKMREIDKLLAQTSRLANGRGDLSVEQFRLYADFDMSASGKVVTIIPRESQLVSLYGDDGYNNYVLPSSLTLDFTTGTSGKKHAMYLYVDPIATADTTDNAKVVAEFEVWTNETTRATALVSTEGVMLKTGSLSRRWIGDAYYDGTAVFVQGGIDPLMGRWYGTGDPNNMSGGTTTGYGFQVPGVLIGGVRYNSFTIKNDVLQVGFNTDGQLLWGAGAAMASASGLALGTPGALPTSSTVGSGLFIDSAGIYSLLANVQQATLTSAGITWAAGAVVGDVNGLTFNQSGSFLVFQNQTTGTYSVGAKQNAGEYGLQEIAFTALATPSITNPGAETGDMTGWTTIAGTPTASTVQKHAGSYSFLLNATSEGIISTSFTSITGPSGLLELWMYASAYGVILQAEIKCYNAGSVLLGTANAMMISAPSSGETGIGRFAKYYFAGAYVSGTTKIKIAITNIGSGSLYVDDIVFRDGTGYQVGISTTWPGMLLSGNLQVSNNLDVDGSAYITGALTTASITTDSISGTSGALTIANRLIASTFFNLGTASTLTIASGEITITRSRHKLDTEGAGATDNLDTINGGSANDMLILSTVNNGRDVTVKDSTGNILLAGGDFVMDTVQDTLTLMRLDASNWVEIARSNNA